MLAPVNDIAPGWRHPLLGSTASELLASGGALGRIERLGPLETL